jgi:dTDP-glucose 4,6-dehydratase
VPTFIRQALENEPLTVCGDGSQTRSFCYVDDLVEGLCRLACSSVHKPVNIGNPAEFTLSQLADLVLEVTGSASTVVYQALPTDDPKVRCPDISRAARCLDWGPAVQLRDGLQRTVEFERRRDTQGVPEFD